MKKYILFLLFLSLISIGFSESTTKLTKLNVELEINNDLSINHIINLSIYNNNSDKYSNYFYLFLSDQPDKIDIIDENNNKINFTIYKINNGLSIKIEDKLKPNETKEYRLTYKSKDLIQKFNGNYLFSYNYKSAYELNNFNVKLILPKGYGTTLDVLEPILPPTSSIFSNGQQIIIEWKEPLHYLETNNYSVFFEKINVNSYSLIISILSFILGIIIGAIGVYFLMKRNKKNFVAMALTNDEKKVMDFIIEVGNKAYQKDICKSLDFSKPKLSKIITQLKNKKIIDSIREGRKSLIIINNKIL